MYKRSSSQRDWWLASTLIVSVIASVASFLWYFYHGQTLAYNDAQSHLLITRRVIDSPDSGFGQLGAVWLPTPHILTLILIQFDWFYHTGIAGSVISMICYCLATVFIYKTVYSITDDKRAGAVGALAFGLNPNILYMQTTAMTELPLYAACICAVYFLIRLNQKISDGATRRETLPYVLAAFASIAIATSVRYEAWVLFVAGLFFFFYFNFKKYDWKKAWDLSWFYLFVGGIGIGLWVAWNSVIFGDPFYFQRGEYAKPSLWVESGEMTVGNARTSFMTYNYAMWHNIGFLIVLGSIGLVLFLKKNKLQPENFPVLIHLVQYAFFVPALYFGQRPLHVQEIQNAVYNRRFALIMIIPIAIFAAYATKGKAMLQLSMAILVTCGYLLLLHQNGVAALEDPLVASQGESSVAARTASEWLSNNYDGRPILMENYGNEEVVFRSQIDLCNVVYEGSNKNNLWNSALSNPANYVDWVYMRDDTYSAADKVWTQLHAQMENSKNFVKVYDQDGITIYYRSVKFYIFQSCS